MLEARSPLGSNARFERNGVSLSEAAGFMLTQVAGEDKLLKKLLGKLPTKLGVVVEHDDRSILRIAPKQLWVLGNAPQSSEGVYMTPLSSGRTRFLLEGPRARDVLSACALIDFDPREFKAGQFVMTGVHHTPVLIHCIGDNSFHIYALRTFALNVWEWLCDVVEGLPPDSAPVRAATS
jgi:methylglutamate dehydrogenase subunit D